MKRQFLNFQLDIIVLQYTNRRNSQYHKIGRERENILRINYFYRKQYLSLKIDMVHSPYI